ncbi:MAG: hypothetical protein O7G31_02960 [Calditrichaeota bacterium]|nr:hypothetical protein [Calditrichota bacterium]
MLGQEVVRLVDGQVVAGRHSVKWDAANTQGAAVASGLYFYQIITDGKSLVWKMLLLR